MRDHPQWRGVADYRGKRVLVTGAGSGIGAAVVDELLSLGSEVFATDVAPIDREVAGAYIHDIRDTEANQRALDRIGHVDAFFGCAGVSSLADPVDVVAINFLAARTLTDRVVEHMGPGGAICLAASVAARGWRGNIGEIDRLLATPDFDSGVALLREHGFTPAPYPFSKMATVVWAMRRCRDLGGRGIRINTLSPGATITPMMQRMFAENPAAEAALETRDRALKRFSQPSEQAQTMVFLNSAAAGYITGIDLISDGGEFAGTATTVVAAERLDRHPQEHAGGSKK